MIKDFKYLSKRTTPDFLEDLIPISDMIIYHCFVIFPFQNKIFNILSKFTFHCHIQWDISYYQSSQSLELSCRFPDQSNRSPNTEEFPIFQIR